MLHLVKKFLFFVVKGMLGVREILIAELGAICAMSSLSGGTVTNQDAHSSI